MMTKKQIVTKTLLATALLTGGIGAITAHSAPFEQFQEPPFEGYKVVEGDSFWFIAKRYGLDFKELMRLNPNVDPLNMQIGSTIRLKESGSSSNQKVGNFEAQVGNLVNKERQKQGLAPLTLMQDISSVAEKKAIEMNRYNYFSHTSPRYGSPFDMLKNHGIAYQSAGENIAKGQRTPEEVMQAWMNSPGHRKNILDSNFNQIGVGYADGVWVQMFVKR
jgi:uncharacterized YkwD family protein